MKSEVLKYKIDGGGYSNYNIINIREITIDDDIEKTFYRISNLEEQEWFIEWSYPDRIKELKLKYKLFKLIE